MRALRVIAAVLVVVAAMIAMIGSLLLFLAGDTRAALLTFFVGFAALVALGAIDALRELKR